ncbi:NAD(P)/FAD-dependent oxidoreductase [Streptomyces sp. NPDC058701]|uniref:NAD(P)/FAD-dependent oxidoreductase n=1 Tax=Streptomyces sp. NPDC058701 TaxID=3346608 RepID=UPI00364B5062
MNHYRHGIPASHRPFNHAIVVGAGVAGLLAARVLSEHFENVTIIERDRLGGARAFRSGTPQARHAHVMIARGSAEIDTLFPGMAAELEEAGAPTFDAGEKIVRRSAGVWFPKVRLGVQAQCFSRPLLEDRLRSRTFSLLGVTIMEGCSVDGICVVDGRVTGVTLHGRTTSQTLNADLVVEASGRSSHLADWFDSAGLLRPEKTVVNARLSYASRIYENPSAMWPEWNLLVDWPQAPVKRRGCAAQRIEGDRMLVTLSAAGESMPHSTEEFSDFVHSLQNPVSAAVESMQPVSPVYRYGRTENRRFSYGQARGFPDGIIVMGDSLCALNPVYAQGMTISLLTATVLRSELAIFSKRRNLHGFGPRCQRKIARVTWWPWLFATATDWGWLESGNPPVAARCLRWYMRRWLPIAPTNPATGRRLTAMIHMLAGPLVLFHPADLYRIALRSMKGMKRRGRK